MKILLAFIAACALFFATVPADAKKGGKHKGWHHSKVYKKHYGWNRGNHYGWYKKKRGIYYR